MSYITRNANLMLLVLIMLSSVALAGATIYFQNNFERINTEYTEKLDQLSTVKKELDNYQSTLNQVKTELQTKSTREQQFTEKFTEVRSEREQLASQINNLEKDKAKFEAEANALRADLQRKIKELSDSNQQVVTLNDQIKTMTVEKNNLNNIIQQLQSEKKSLQERLNLCLNPPR